MARKYEIELIFSDAWGGKLQQPIFSTFRWPNRLYKVGSIVPVRLVGGLFNHGHDYGLHKIVSVEFKRILEVTVPEILADIGRARVGADPRNSFLEIFRTFYSKKDGWDGVYSIVQKLMVEKMGG